MAMKKLLFPFMLIPFYLSGWTQTPYPFYHAFQIKVDPLEIGYTFPRLGICFEQKSTLYSYWSSFHYGWDGISIDTISRYYDGEFNYWGIKAGLKRIHPISVGEYFVGGQLEYDKTGANILNDVYYDLNRNIAVLFDNAKYQRSRVGLFLNAGFELYFGHRFSMEVSAGPGIRRIEKWYKQVVNPFVLNDVEPREFRTKGYRKYLNTVWNPAFIGAVKFGIRL